MARRQRTAILRPPARSRVMAVGFGVVLALISMALDTTLSGWQVVFLVFEAALIGLLFNAARNQGVWLLDGKIVLETAFGRAAIPLEDVVAVHVEDALTTIGVETDEQYVVLSIGSPAGPRIPAGTVAGTTAALAAREVPAVWHPSPTAVRAVRRSFEPWQSIGAIIDTLRRPLVVGTVITGALYVLVVASMG